MSVLICNILMGPSNRALMVVDRTLHDPRPVSLASGCPKLHSRKLPCHHSARRTRHRNCIDGALIILPLGPPQAHPQAQASGSDHGRTRLAARRLAFAAETARWPKRRKAWAADACAQAHWRPPACARLRPLREVRPGACRTSWAPNPRGCKTEAKHCASAGLNLRSARPRTCGPSMKKFVRSKLARGWRRCHRIRPKGTAPSSRLAIALGCLPAPSARHASSVASLPS